MSGQSRAQIQNLERIGQKFLQRLGDLSARDLADVWGYLSSNRSVDKAPGAITVRNVVFEGLETLAQIAPNMTVQVTAGMGFAPSSGTAGVVNALDQTLSDSNVVMLNKRKLSAAIAIAAAPGAGSYRYDLIELKPAALLATETDDQAIVDIWSDAAGAFVPDPGGNSVIMRHGEGDIIVTTGIVDNGIPAPHAGSIPIAVVRVANGATSIAQDAIFDLRIMVAELARRGTAQHSAWIDVGELNLDVPFPASGTTSTLATFQIDALAGGIPSSIKTASPVDLKYNSLGFQTLFDRVTQANITGGTGPEWIYCYLVSLDDQGYRLSHSTFGNAAIPFAHSGWLVWSHVPPDLSNGLMAPSAILSMPASMGLSSCTPGTGRAVCVGVAYWGTGGSLSFKYGLRSTGGKAEFTWLAQPPLYTSPATPTWVVEGGGLPASGVAAYYANWASTNPKGPLSWDAQIGVTVANLAVVGARREFIVYENVAGATYKERPRAFVESVVHAGSSIGGCDISAPEMTVAHAPYNRGLSPSGFYLQCTVTYGAGGGGSNLRDPAVNAPTFAMAGYRWPSGPCIA